MWIILFHGFQQSHHAALKQILFFHLPRHMVLKQTDTLMHQAHIPPCQLISLLYLSFLPV